MIWSVPVERIYMRISAYLLFDYCLLNSRIFLFFLPSIVLMHDLLAATNPCSRPMRFLGYPVGRHQWGLLVSPSILIVTWNALSTMG